MNEWKGGSDGVAFPDLTMDACRLTGRAFFAITLVILSIRVDLVSAQESHHPDVTSNDVDASADTSAWADVHENVRFRFDSTFVAALRNPKNLDSVYLPVMDLYL